MEVIRSLPPPKSVKEVWSFLGMTGYYHQCIPGYAHLAAPLTALTRKNARFIWHEAHQAAFDQLKEALCSDAVILQHPDPTKPYILHTASDYAVGAILTQEGDDGLDRPVQYISKTLSESQQKWTAIVKEAYAIVYALGRLRPYLQGAAFVVYTDHKPLKSLFQCEMCNTMIQHWAMQIAEFGCEIKYRPGKHNIRADMLSRIHREPPKTLAGLSVTVRELGVAKQQQAEFPTEWAEAEANDDDDGGDYMLIDGMLYSLIRPYSTALECQRLLVPEGERARLIAEVHEETGHHAVLPTLRYLQAFGVWPGMAWDIKECLAECPICEVNRQAPPKSRLTVTETPNRPFGCVGVDLIGPLPLTMSGFRYVLTAVCHLTGWAEAIPIPNKWAGTVWAAMEREIFARWDYPRELVLDNRMEFVSADTEALLQQHGIRHLRTTPFHPQSNGVTERFNKTLKLTLIKLVNHNPNQWGEVLARAMWAYRRSPQVDRGGRSPYQNLFGWGPGADSPCQAPDVSWVESQAINQMGAYQCQAGRKQQQQAAGPQLSPAFQPGDMVTITAGERAPYHTPGGLDTGCSQ